MYISALWTKKLIFIRRNYLIWRNWDNWPVSLTCRTQTWKYQVRWRATFSSRGLGRNGIVCIIECHFVMRLGLEIGSFVNSWVITKVSKRIIYASAIVSPKVPHPTLNQLSLQLFPGNVYIIQDYNFTNIKGLYVQLLIEKLIHMEASIMN